VLGREPMLDWVLAPELGSPERAFALQLPGLAGSQLAVALWEPLVLPPLAERAAQRLRELGTKGPVKRVVSQRSGGLQPVPPG
jgi:hypothetical protein